MKGKLVVGNWKMNGALERNAILLFELSKSRLKGVEMVVCVPYPYLSQCQALLGGAVSGIGAQNVSEFQNGAYTGEVCAEMLREFDCRYVIVGHSERRALFGELDEVVARKAKAVLNAGMTPIFCIGESQEERNDGRVEAVLLRQLEALCAEVDVATLMKIVVAYEPVWAIGTGQAATPDQVQQVLCFIREWFVTQCCRADAVTVLYGGSVKPDNAAELFALPDCDGGLIGGASLVAADFLVICQAAQADA